MSAEQVTLREIFQLGEEKIQKAGAGLDLDQIAETILNQGAYESGSADPDCNFKVRL